ncbi:MAG: DUF4190 domain-containing protein [Bacteroidetes bacterium]|nr:DUF4190 domain-containing protein [Bacteroidota bacterium]
MKKLYFLFFVFVLLSCGVQKRKYRDGYYIDKPSSKQKTPNKNKEEEVYVGKPDNSKPQPDTKKVENVVVPPENTTAQTNSDDTTDLVVTEKTTTCDVVVMRSGSEIQAKVLEITQTEVKYKKCTMPDGPLFVVRKNDVFMMRYANGTKEVFPEPLTQNAPQQIPQEQIEDYRKQGKTREMHPDAVSAFVHALFGNSVRAIVRGFDALQDIKQHPLDYKGEGLAKAAIVIGFVWLFLIIAVMALMIIAFFI